MKTYILTIALFCMALFASAQNDDTKIVIISGDQTLSPEDVEITIKKDGKKVKVDPSDIEIISKDFDEDISFNFNDMGGIEDMMQLNFQNLRMQMQRMFEGMPDMGGMDDMNSLKFFRKFNGDSYNMDDFNKRFDSIQTDVNQLELGNGNHTYLFKSDDGRTIIKEEEIHIDKNIDEDSAPVNKSNGDNFMGFSTENRPLIFINGEEYTGDMNNIDESGIYSMEVERGTKVVKKFGEKGKNGVVYIKTRE